MDLEEPRPAVPRKGLVLALLGLGLAVAIAIPAALRFLARARQASCKAQLERALAAERTFHAANQRFSTHPAEVGLQAEARGQALLRFDGIGVLSPPGAPAAPEAVGFAPLGPEGESLDERLPEEVRAQLGVRGACPDCSITLACAVDLDRDPTLDVWSLSSGPRARPGAEAVAAGALFHHVDDLTEEVQALPPFGLRTTAPPTVPAARTEAVAEEDEPRSWQTYAFDGRTGLKEKAVGDRCLLTCTREDGTRAWEALGACQSSRGERRFLAPDGERLVVLVPAPARGKPWASTEVMRVYQRGVLAYAVRGPGVLPEEAMAASTTWLQGCFGAPGEEPRYAADGQAVEYVTIAGTRGRVSLKAEAPEPPAPPPRRKKPKR